MINSIWIPTTYYSSIDVDELERAGITDVFIKTNRVTSPTYETVLPSVLAAFEDTNINVHAWITCFKDANDNWVNPNNTTHKNTLYSWVETLLTGYPDIAGINLDYVRYPGSGSLIAGEQELHGGPLITDFVSNIKTKLIAAESTNNKEYILSACLMPEMGVNSYYYGQDYAQLNPYLDWQIPMVYLGNYNKSVSWINLVIKYIRERIGTSKLVSGIQTYISDSNTTPKTTNALITEMNQALESGADGVAYFRYGLIPEYPPYTGTVPEDITDPALPPAPVTEESILLADDGLIEGNKIAVCDYNGDWRVYEIKNADITISEGEDEVKVEAENIYYELADLTPLNKDLTNVNPTEALQEILKDTFWDPGVCNVNRKRRTIKTKNMNPLEALREIETLFNGELDFKVYINDNKISAREVNFYEQVGSWEGKRLEFGHNLQGVNIVTDRREIKTAILAQATTTEGEGEQEVEVVKDLTSLVWKKDTEYPIYTNGPTYPAPVNKAAGTPLLAFEDLKQKYGIYNPKTGQIEHRILYYMDDGEYDEKSLPWVAYDELLRHATPLINITADAVSLDQALGYDHERLRVGDMVLLVIEDRTSVIPARIIQTDRTLNEPDKSEYELGNFQRSGSRIRIKNRLIEYPTQMDLISRPSRGDEGRIELPDTDYTDPTGPDQAPGTITYTRYQDMLTRVTNWQNTYGYNPNYVFVEIGKPDTVLWNVWVSVKAWVDNYISTQGRPPTYVPLIPAPTTGTITGPNTHQITGYVVYKQANGVYCGPASLRGILGYYGCLIEQHTLAAWAGTGSNGTGPDGLRAAVIRAASYCNKKFSWFDGVWPGWAFIQDNYISKNIPVILQHNTGPLPNYSGAYDHYAVMVGYNASEVLIADPGKGIQRWYTKTTMENALKARASFGSFKHIKGILKG